MEVTNQNEKEVKPIKYFTFINMNKPVYFWGFTSFQLIGGVGLIIVLGLFAFMFFKIIVGVFVLIILGVPLFIVMGKIRNENSKGNPDYVADFMLWQETPRKVTDEHNVLGIIYKKEHKNGKPC